MTGANLIVVENAALDGDDTLDTIAGKIKACLKRFEDYRVTAGQLLAEARRRVDAGEAGKIGWEAWCKANVDRSYRDVQRLLAIAKAPDPDAAAAIERAGARLSMATSRGDKRLSSPSVTSTVDDLPVPPIKEILAWVEVFRRWPTHVRKSAAETVYHIYRAGEPPAAPPAEKESSPTPPAQALAAGMAPAVSADVKKTLNKMTSAYVSFAADAEQEFLSWFDTVALDYDARAAISVQLNTCVEAYGRMLNAVHPVEPVPPIAEASPVQLPADLLPAEPAPAAAPAPVAARFPKPEVAPAASPGAAVDLEIVAEKESSRTMLARLREAAGQRLNTADPVDPVEPSAPVVEKESSPTPPPVPVAERFPKPSIAPAAPKTDTQPAVGLGMPCPFHPKKVCGYACAKKGYCSAVGAAPAAAKVQS